MSAPPVVRFRGAARRYGSEFRLGPLDLEVGAGEWVALEGRSGAGKTTLLLLAGGLDRADAGDVELFGERLAVLSNDAIAALRGRGVGVVHQEPLFLDHLTVWENVAARLVPRGVPARERRERARAVLASVDLAHAADRRPRHLSGGERQRVSLARALVADPALILADEPTANVDAETGARVLEVLRERHARGAAILASSHDTAVLAAADRRLPLSAGTLVA